MSSAVINVTDHACTKFIAAVATALFGRVIVMMEEFRARAMERSRSCGAFQTPFTEELPNLHCAAVCAASVMVLR